MSDIQLPEELALKMKIIKRFGEAINFYRLFINRWTIVKELIEKFNWVYESALNPGNVVSFDVHYVDDERENMDLFVAQNLSLQEKVIEKLQRIGNLLCDDDFRGLQSFTNLLNITNMVVRDIEYLETSANNISSKCSKLFRDITTPKI